MASKTIYRSLLRATRDADANPALLQELLRSPIPILQAASAGVDRLALNVDVLFDSEGVPKHLAGTRQSLPRRHVVGVARHVPKPHPGNAPGLDASTAVGDAAPATESEASTEGLQLGTSTSSPSNSNPNSGSGGQPAPFADGAAVCAMHPSYGRDVMGGGDAYWDAEVVAALPGGSLCLHFGDGDKCTWPAADVASAVFLKKPLHEMLGRHDASASSAAEPTVVAAPDAAGVETTPEHSSPSSSSSAPSRQVLAAGEFYGRRAEHPKWYRGSVTGEEEGEAPMEAAGSLPGDHHHHHSSSNAEVPQGRLTEFFRRAARDLPAASTSSANLRCGGGALGLRSVDSDPCFLGDYSRAAELSSSSSCAANNDRAPNVHPNAAQTLQSMSPPPQSPLRFDPLDVALEVLAATESARKSARLGSSGNSNNAPLWLAAHVPKQKWANWGGASGAGRGSNVVVGGVISGRSENSNNSFNSDTNSGSPVLDESTVDEAGTATKEADDEESALTFEAEAAALASLGAFWRAVGSRSTLLMEALWTGRRDAPSPLLPAQPSLLSASLLSSPQGTSDNMNSSSSGGGGSMSTRTGTSSSSDVVGHGVWANIATAGPAKPVCVQPGQRVLRGLPSIEAFWRSTWAAEAAAWAAASGNKNSGFAMDNLSVVLDDVCVNVEPLDWSKLRRLADQRAPYVAQLQRKFHRQKEAELSTSPTTNTENSVDEGEEVQGDFLEPCGVEQIVRASHEATVTHALNGQSHTLACSAILARPLFWARPSSSASSEDWGALKGSSDGSSASAAVVVPGPFRFVHHHASLVFQ